MQKRLWVLYERPEPQERGRDRERYGVRKRVRRLIALFLCLLCIPAAAAALPREVRAAEKIDTGRAVTLRLRYAYDGAAIPGAEFSLYKVGSVDAYGKITVSDLFRSYPISLHGLDQKGWNELAVTLEGYVQRDKLGALDHGKTNSSGMLTFPFSSSSAMRPGLYLVIGREVTIGNYIYSANPFMVFLPGEDRERNTWVYDVTVRPKTERRTAENKTVARRVLKIWNDSGHESARPAEIRIQLLRDGEFYERVVLNAGNGWQHTWNNLNSGNRWTVVEEDAGSYTVSVARTGDSFTVRNTYQPPAAPGQPAPPAPPTGPGGGAAGAKKAPQTGLLWWPVPLLAAAGLLFLMIGAAGLRGRSRRR